MSIALVGDRIEVRYTVGDPKGNSTSSPWLIADIAAAVAEVIVVGKIYTFPSINIHVYSGAYLKILDSILIFTGTFAGGGSLVRANGGWLQIGEKDVNNKYSKGCVIDMSQMSTSVKFCYFDNLYDSYIIGGADKRLGGMQGVNTENSKISGQGTSNSNLSGILKYLQISDSGYGLRPTVAITSVDNVIFSGCNIGIWIYATTVLITGFILRNVKFINSAIAIRQESLANNSTENTFIGVTFEGNTTDIDNKMSGTTTQYTYSKLNFGEEFSITVTDSSGVAIEGVTVLLKDKNGDTVFSELTDSDGVYNQDVIRFIRLSEKNSPAFTEVVTETNFNPFTLTVSYAGKQTYEAKITISAKSDLQIMLGDEVAPVSSDVTGIKIADSLAINAVNGKLIMLI